MSTVTFEIDGKTVQAEEGISVLEAATENGVKIPTLCYDKRLQSFGECRLCMVEVTKGKRTRLVASCVYQIAEGIVVKTDTEKVKKIRKMIVELLWPSLPKLAEEYGLRRSRFSAEHTECNLCGKCVRYCAELKKMNAVYFKGRGVDREIALVPDLMKECVYCRECFDMCTGGRIVDMCDEAYAR